MIKRKDLLFFLLVFLLVTLINVFCLHGFTVNGIMQSCSALKIGVYTSILFIVYKINDRYLNPIYRYMAIGMCLIQLFSNCSVARIVFNNFVKDSLVSLSKVLFVTSILEIIFYFFLFYFHKKNYDIIRLFIISMCLVAFGIALMNLPNKGIVYMTLRIPLTMEKKILYVVLASMNSILLIKTNNIKGKIKEKSLMLIKVSFILKIILFLFLLLNNGLGIMFAIKYIFKICADVIILYLIFTEAVEKPNYRIIRDLDKGKAIKEYNELVFKKVPFGVLVIDNNNKILEFNNGLEKMFGINNIKKLSDFLDKRSLEQIKNIQSNDSVIITDIETVVDNIKKGIQVYFFKLSEVENKFVYVFVNMEDKKKFEEMKALLLAKEKEEQMKTELLSNISHEFKTPVNVIYSAVQMQEKLLHNDESMSKYNEIMKQNCYRLIRLINNFIDCSKMDFNNNKINFKVLNIVSLVEDTTLSVVPYAESMGISVIFDTMYEEIAVKADFNLMERVILNLLSNAIKYNKPDGKIFVNIDTDNDYVYIKVKDTGIGIPDNRVMDIFNRFERLDKRFSREKEGSGLGLNIVKKIVEKHNGTIIVNSEENKGTMFTIKLKKDNEEIIYDDNMQSSNKDSVNVKIEMSDIYLK